MALVAGELTVQLEFGCQLRDVQWFGRQDPYCLLSVGPKTLRSRTHNDGGRNPVWNQPFQFSLHSETELCITVKDQEVFEDSHIGVGKASLVRVRAQGTDRQQVPIISQRGRAEGFVQVTLKFERHATASGPAQQGFTPYTSVGHAQPMVPPSPSPYSASGGYGRPTGYAQPAYGQQPAQVQPAYGQAQAQSAGSMHGATGPSWGTPPPLYGHAVQGAPHPLSASLTSMPQQPQQPGYPGQPPAGYPAAQQPWYGAPAYPATPAAHPPSSYGASSPWGSYPAYPGEGVGVGAAPPPPFPVAAPSFGPPPVAAAGLAYPPYYRGAVKGC